MPARATFRQPLMKDTRHIILGLERFLTETIRVNPVLTVADVQPNLVVRQILDQLSHKRFIWINGRTYVPNRLVIAAIDNAPSKLEELEVLFNSVVFTKFLYDYITESGFRLLEPFIIEIAVHRLPAEPAGGGCVLRFEWGNPTVAPDALSVTVDEETKRILEVHGIKPQIPRIARLQTLNGQTYRDPYFIAKRTTFLGRLQNVRDRRSGEVLRRNDLAYSRLDDDLSPNKTVSRQHASIVFEDGVFFLFDNGSANGTSIERAEKTIDVAPRSVSGVALQDGDIIRLGTALIRFALDPDVSQITTPDRAIASDLIGEVESGTNVTVRVPPSEIIRETNRVLDSE